MTNKIISSDWQDTEDQLHAFKPGARAEVEDENASIISPTLELNSMKIASQLHVFLNLDRLKNCGRCRQVRRFGSRSQNYLDVINAGKGLTPTCFDAKEVNLSSRQMLCRTLALFNITSEALPASCICECVKQTMRIRSMSNVSSLSFQYSGDDQFGNRTMSSSTRWAFDSVDKMLRKKTLRKFLPFVESVPPDVIGQALSPCHSKTSEFSASTSSTRSENLEAEQVQDRRESVKGNHNRLSSSSNNSGGCTEPLVTSALLYCVWDGNIPIFLFSEDDSRGSLFVARPVKINCSVDKDLDYIYTFHSLNHVTGDYCFVGRMKVSNSVCLDSRRAKFMESRFVLFGAKEDHYSDPGISISNVTRGSGLSRKLIELFRPKKSTRIKRIDGKLSTSSKLSNLQDLLRNELGTIDDYVCRDFRPVDELAAIIVKDYRYGSTNLSSYSGWGLKFLQKADSSEVRQTEGPSRTVNVIVPAGYHGGSVIKSSCPSTLIERWTLKGHCDCGGWDSGCPLKVFRDSSSSKHLEKQKLDGDTTFELFTEGSKQDEPTLKLVNARKDVYSLKFQPKLSALQCFAISVAVIHSRTPDLSPKL